MEMRPRFRPARLSALRIYGSILALSNLSRSARLATLDATRSSVLVLLVNKHFRISVGRELQFRSEFFNVMNHVNLAPPLAAPRQIFDNNGLLAGSYGQITKTTTPSRQIQFGLKYIF